MGHTAVISQKMAFLFASFVLVVSSASDCTLCALSPRDLLSFSSKHVCVYEGYYGAIDLSITHWNIAP
jgi:hypothetical protein